ncbi:MAG: hypothetical protein ACXQS2_00355 [Methermicoccaceae archaeon]
MGDDKIVEAIDRNTKAIQDGVKTIRKWIIAYIIFWSICWFAFVAFWVWRYTRGG